MRKRLLKVFPFLVGILTVGLVGWAHITLNLLGVPLGQSVTGSSGTDQYVVTYNHATRTYELLAGTGGGGSGGVVGFFAKSKGVTQAGTPTTLDVDEGLTGVVSGSTFRVT